MRRAKRRELEVLVGKLGADVDRLWSATNANASELLNLYDLLDNPERLPCTCPKARRRRKPSLRRLRSRFRAAWRAFRRPPAPATVASVSDVLKEVWTSPGLSYALNEAGTKTYTTPPGRQATIPIRKDRP